MAINGKALSYPAYGGEVILDVGCAKGDFLGWLAKNHILKMYGCDAYSGGIREGYSIDFLGKDLPDCHYPTAYFDYVTSWAVLGPVNTI
ncbi:methyltransferase domain-containing protein [Desulfovibrio sp.]|uniref:methyltransferase domain-containing protein n=1 Tax=Desulfovibrio sp. TaxID=885 RepID=UPI00345C2F48